MLIIITGLPGSGKTTLARLLAAQIDAKHLNSDIIRAELGKQGQYDEATKTVVYQELLKRSKALLQEGDRVIVDATLYRTTYRIPYYELSDHIKWIELVAKDMTIKNRVSEKRPYSEANYAVYCKLKTVYENLEMERLVLASDELTKDEMVEKAKAYLALEKVTE